MTVAPAAAAALADQLLERCPFPPSGTPVTCAFSVGAASPALVVIAGQAGCEVTAIHVDHGLRPSSTTEADQAVAIAGRLGVPCRVERAVIGPGPNVEARARSARAAALPRDALTGHTADDQAETVLVNLLRGAGVDGIAAIAPGPTHPLLALRRSDTVALCDAVGVTPVSDPSNRDPRFVRNRIRHEVLPLLDDIAGRDVASLLARTAAVVRADADLLADVTSDAMHSIDPSDARSLAALPPTLTRRVLRTWLVRDGYPPDHATVERAYDVVTGASRACDLGSHWRLERHHQTLSIVPPEPLASTDGMKSHVGAGTDE
ncbi:hypothetical protein BH24ACT5_BH24ACT5_06840 [soil metagenome]